MTPSGKRFQNQMDAAANEAMRIEELQRMGQQAVRQIQANRSPRTVGFQN